MTRVRRPGVSSDHEHYKWWALSCTSLGMLLATINSGTLIIALPDLESALGTSILALVWVILAYMIASTVLVLMAGRLSDVFGRKRAYVGGFVLFGVASLGAGFAPDGTTLILWRVLQGIGGAFLFANASALVTDAFPREQLGLAMGTNTMVAAIGLVLGPVLGGALVAISWHWVFWFNVPFSAAGALWAALVLRELAKPDDVRGLDPVGTGTFVVGLTGLVLGLSRGGISGWDDPLTIGSLAVGAVLLPLFVLIERRQRAAMLDLSIFRNRMFAAATAAAFINGLSRFALMFLFVFYFQGVKGDDPITAGIELAPMAIGMLVASPLAGIWASSRVIVPFPLRFRSRDAYPPRLLIDGPPPSRSKSGGLLCQACDLAPLGPRQAVGTPAGMPYELGESPALVRLEPAMGDLQLVSDPTRDFDRHRPADAQGERQEARESRFRPGSHRVSALTGTDRAPGQPSAAQDRVSASP
jgi:MFS family permease